MTTASFLHRRTVPRWLTGCWHRASIIIADGTVDATTRVVYLQTGSRYADIRVDPNRPSFAHRRSLSECSTDELLELAKVLADYGVCEVAESAARDEPGLLEAPVPRPLASWGPTVACAAGAKFRKRFEPLGEHFCFATEKRCASAAGLRRHLAGKPFARWKEEVPPASEWVYEDHEVARWHAESNYQPVAFYPEPGLLALFPDRLLEIAPSRAYREDWRLMKGSATVVVPEEADAAAVTAAKAAATAATAAAAARGEEDNIVYDGPVISLRLVQEQQPATSTADGEAGAWVKRSGGLLMCGDHAILVRDRLSPSPLAAPLTDVVSALHDSGDRTALLALLDCEYTYLTRKGSEAASTRSSAKNKNNKGGKQGSGPKKSQKEKNATAKKKVSSKFIVQLSTLPFEVGGSPEGSEVDLFGSRQWKRMPDPNAEGNTTALIQTVPGGVTRQWEVESWNGHAPPK